MGNHKRNKKKPRKPTRQRKRTNTRHHSNAHHQTNTLRIPLDTTHHTTQHYTNENKPTQMEKETIKIIKQLIGLIVVTILIILLTHT